MAVFALAGCSGSETADPAAPGTAGGTAAASPAPSAITIAAAPELSEEQKQEFLRALKDVDAGVAANQAQAISVGIQVCEKILASPDDPMTFAQFAGEQLSLDPLKAEGFVVAVSSWCTPE
ncbi:DUF732 domain-containing protein [Acrocarpospora phusangensis]|uniref:DUF732 domain-containing protein n=1 Tax=Acrocarpospora phusangensis TaxID=1070424 RepID=UPI0019509746|nr:DUF732 domain-containing protein [Acrocarpospora phusangensis]